MKKFVLGFICLIFVTFPAYAQDSKVPNTHSVAYDFDFFIDNASSRIDVDLAITLTNKRSDVYISEYTLTFPNSLSFDNLRITHDSEDVPFKHVTNDNTQRITIQFPEPLEGAFASNRFKLHYSLAQLHASRGRIHEVILPLLVQDPTATINATLHLPEQFDQKISLSKPIPSSVEFRTIRWENTQARTLYMLFGESQTYNVQLGYSLRHDNLTTQNMEVAFPPETLYQKVFVKKLQPVPDRTYTDIDGNFIGVYSVQPRQTLPIRFEGMVEVLVKPQDSMREYIRSQFIAQQPYLLAEKPLWDLGMFVSTPEIQKLAGPQDIYSHILSTFAYGTTRLSSSMKRLGAKEALANPLLAVCTEYTDAFIAIAREKGIPSREIQGYGYSESTKIRPISGVLDELHAWPEYYDTREEIWKQIDPTWEDTSGIDYFSSLDVNHIALAIHGKDPLKPKPAGFYKTARRKDVHVTSTHIKPSSSIQLEVHPHFQSRFIPGTTYTQKITVKNAGPAYIHQAQLTPQAQHITFQNTQIPIAFMAPFEERDIHITFTVEDEYSDNDTIEFLFDGDVLGAQEIRISKTTPGVVGVVAAVLFVGFLSFVLFRRRT